MRSLFWVSAVLIVISVFASVNLWQELREERQRAAALPAQQSQARSSTATIQSASPGTAPAMQEVAALPAAALVPAAASSMPTEEMSARLRNSALQQQKLLRDPEYRKALIAQTRVSIVRDNPYLAEELGLSQSEANRMFDLMAEFTMDMTGNLVLEVLGGRSRGGSIEESLQKTQERARLRDERITALLGPEKFAKWQEYEQNGSARSRATSMSNMLAQAGQPLNPSQLKSLNAVMVAETRRQRGETIAWPRIDPQDPAGRAQLQELMRNREQATNQRILAAAAPIMSARQLATVRAQIETQDALSRSMSRARERVTTVQPQ